MIVTTTNINHRIKNLEPIYTLARNPTNGSVVSGGMNGEMKCWIKRENGLYKLVKTVRRHKGAVVAAKFTGDGKYLISGGDDGRVLVYENNSLKYSYDKSKDDIAAMVTFMGKDAYFVYVLDIKNRITLYKFTSSTGIESVENIEFDEKVYAITTEEKGEFIYIQTETRLAKYKGTELVKECFIEKGYLVEHMAGKLSIFGNYMVVGTQLNNGSPSVDVYTKDLKRMYSLVGHVAPSEVITALDVNVKINQNGKEETKRTTVVIIFSQDTTVSFWTTLNCKPFLLLKNFSKSPALDYFWDENKLLVSFYDGKVRQIEFTDDEVSRELVTDVRPELLPFSITSKQLSKVNLKRGEYKPIERRQSEMQIVKENRANNIGRQISGDLNSTIERITSEPKKDEEIVAERSNEPNKPTEEKNKSTAVKIDITKRPTLINPHPTPIEKRPNKAEVPIKRIKPTLQNPPKDEPKQSSKESSLKYTSNDNSISFQFEDADVHIKPTEEFAQMVNLKPNRMISDTFISIEYKDKQIVARRESEIYRIQLTEPTHICYSSELLVVYEQCYLKIYDIKKGVLLNPYICKQISYIAIDNRTILIVDTQGKISSLIYEHRKINPNKAQPQATLPKLKNFKSIEFIRTRKSQNVLMATYAGNEALVYLDNLWYVLEPIRMEEMAKVGLYSYEHLEALMVINTRMVAEDGRNNQFIESLVNGAYLYVNKMDKINTQNERRLNWLMGLLQNNIQHTEILKCKEEIARIINTKDGGSKLV